MLSTNPQMASKPAFVGVPKRASCNRCSNPIFLAERISFGEKSYHRSCLKCARCGTQLTVGSFYETETDGEYCCETCPDEEIQLEQRRESSPSSDGSGRRSSIISGSGAPVVAPTLGLSKNVRSSKLLDRISFFESAPLSDEEKTSNLERKARMSSFLKETLNSVEQESEEPPDLPATGPPSSVTNDSMNGQEEEAEDTEDTDSDNVEDEFEKLVQDLDDVDAGASKSINQPVLESLVRYDSLNLESQSAQLITERNDKSQQNAPEELKTEDVAQEPRLESNSLEIKEESSKDSEETSPELEEPKPDVTNNIPVELPVEEKEIILEVLTDAKESTTTIENSDNKKESTEEDVVEHNPTESKEQPSLEISKDATTAAEVELIKETDTPASDTVSLATAQQLTVPKEIESAESPSEKLNNATESTENKSMVPIVETVEIAVAESKVPVSEENPTPKVRNEVDKNESMSVASTNADANDQEQYPSNLNPFGDEEDTEEREEKEQLTELRKVAPGGKPVPTLRRVSTNPFGSEDEDEDVLQSPASKPPRPPPPKVKTAPAASKPVPANPFDEDDDATDEPEIVPVSKPSPRRTPVPTPRKAHAYNDSISSLDNSLMSSSRLSSSNVSLASSLESGPSSMIIPRRKKGKAPDIPVATSSPTNVSQQQQMPASSAEKVSTDNLSNSSGSGTLTTPRKKRLAPAPPPVPIVSSTPKQSTTQESGLTRVASQRLLSVDASLLSPDDREQIETKSRETSNESVVYRRTIVPLVIDDDGPESPVHAGGINASGRQWEKMKDNKEAQNRNRQSQSSPTSEGNGQNSFSGSPGGNLSILSNKSSQGKWKRRKGPAPALPMTAAPLPERKPIKMLPLKEIHQELQIIETQQQGLEKQGIVLEKMIRERCEGVEADVDLDIRLQTNSKEVEDLLMQLFELVNEKNELFRRQAELMYLRRMHRLEQEQADLEYEIRLLMAQPERNKTDSDKEKEEALIARLVEIVQLRNEVVECLEMDRIREAEEDLSIKQSIEERAASQQSKHSSSKKDSSASSTTLPLTDAEKRDSSTKLSKKEKKKLKEAKKLVKSKKIDSEKDADETESNTTKEKKKKRKFLF
uniref:LIM zinc-binding domain-containing protein n=1 Tax=Anopheles epiroticus TaxID=199890 RepID=A0A182PS77_9DIPT